MRNFIAYSKHIRSIRPFPNWSKREQRKFLGWLLVDTLDPIRNAGKAKIRLKYLQP